LDNVLPDKKDYDQNDANDLQHTCNYLSRSTLGMLMKVASYLLKLAARCRDLGKTAVEPDVIEQLRIWATELAKMAEDSESRVSPRHDHSAISG
jgi:hypothetical protein